MAAGRDFEIAQGASKIYEKLIMEASLTFCGTRHQRILLAESDLAPAGPSHHQRSAGAGIARCKGKI